MLDQNSIGRKAITKNIEKEISSGKSRSQAVATALDKARVKKKRLRAK